MMCSPQFPQRGKNPMSFWDTPFSAVLVPEPLQLNDEALGGIIDPQDLPAGMGMCGWPPDLRVAPEL